MLFLVSQPNVIIHCCGRTWDILDGFLEAGWLGYQSVQKSAGMDWAKLKQEYGDRLTIWAGVSCETLIEGSREDVEHEVREGIDVLAPGGGFVFGSTNSVQYGANTENYLRALEIAREFRY
jgi:uroporphyrinogen decarboxylase